MRFAGMLLVLGLLMPAATAIPRPARGSVFDVSFRAAGTYANPYTDLTATATLIRPGGETWRVPLFWDGGADWRLRVSPDVAGRWSYRIHSTDAGLNGRRGAFECVPSARRGGIEAMRGYPRHFQYRNGAPFWFLGDTGWGYFTDSAEDKHFRAQAEHYASVRAAQGFNVIHAMLLSEAGDGNDGGPPFRDLSAEQINPAYWQEVDRRLAYANEQGLTVGLALAWADKRKVEPYAWRRFPGLAARLRYARYVAARYSAYDVYFLVAGEWNAEARTRSNVTADALYGEFVEIGDALESADPHERMIGIHTSSRHGSVREFTTAHWMSFADYQQNYADLHRRVLLSERISRPVVNAEYGYLFRDTDGDGVPDKSNSFSVEDMRYASWDIVTAGGYLVTGFGTTYFAGHRDPGPFNVEDPRNATWGRQIQYIKNLFESIDYWKLIPADELLSCPQPRGPDRTRTVKRANGSVRRLSRPPAATYWAMTLPGELYVVYTRGLTDPVTIRLGARPGKFAIRLFNPRTGEFSPPANRELKASHVFTPPDTNDWVLLLERSR